MIVIIKKYTVISPYLDEGKIIFTKIEINFIKLSILILLIFNV